jgi:RNA polymerase sigma factor (sigma-70 family)
MEVVLQHLRKLAGFGDRLEFSDRQLLKRFSAARDEAAFTALVERHGPLVLGVCRRVLQNSQDAEDAFQATFLVLARKAGAMGWQETIGPWLFRVAQRIAIKMRSQRTRRLGSETPLSSLSSAGAGADPENSVDVHQSPTVTAVQKEAARYLDEELDRLPVKYRSPLILCYFQGKTNEQAARELGWPAGSISRHLARARELLRERLVRRGVGCTSAALAGLLVTQELSAAVPPALAQTTAHAGLLFFGRTATAGLISTNALTLAEGMLRTMTVTNLKMAVGVLLVLGVVGFGAGQAVQRDGPGSAVQDPKKGPQIKAADERAAGGGSAPSLQDPEQRIQNLESKLRAAVTLENGVDANTPLQDALQFLSERFDVPIYLDRVAFRPEGDEQVPPLGDRPVQLPKLNGVPLRSALQMLCDQFQGVLLIKPDGIHVTSRKRAWPSYWNRGASRELVPLVDAAFKETTLEEALHELSRQTGINVILDTRAAENQGSALPVRANLRGVPIDTAVRLLANMNGLYVVAVDNVLYVTNSESAQKLLLQMSNEVSGIPPEVEENPFAAKPAAKAKAPPKK